MIVMCSYKFQSWHDHNLFAITTSDDFAEDQLPVALFGATVGCYAIEVKGPFHREYRSPISQYGSSQRCAAIFPAGGMEHSQDDPRRAFYPQDGGRDELIGEVMWKKRLVPTPRGASRTCPALRDRVDL
jgi:hypothetical protein